MFKTIITGIFEVAGKVIGEAAHQTGQIAEAIAEIPEAFQRGYENELFDKNKETTATPTQDTVAPQQQTQDSDAQ